MNNCKIILKKYKKLQKKYKKYNNIYNSYENKGICREDAICDIYLEDKIIIKNNKPEEYYINMLEYIKWCIYLIKNKIKYLQSAILRSY